MKQIKTIFERNAGDFDIKVNAALKDGWKLKNRTLTSDMIGPTFIAMLEKEEHSCSDCRHLGKSLSEEPCCNCGESCCKWEEEENCLELEAPQDDNQETD